MQPIVLIGACIRNSMLSNYMTVILQYWICGPYLCHGAMSHYSVFFSHINGVISKLPLFIVVYCSFTLDYICIGVRPIVCYCRYHNNLSTERSYYPFKILVVLRDHISFYYMIQLSYSIHFL